MASVSWPALSLQGEGMGSSIFNLRYFDSPPGFQGMDKGTQIEAKHFGVHHSSLYRFYTSIKYILNLQILH